MKTFNERVRYAARCILSRNTNQRSFDDCFEMFDGDFVVTQLVREAQADPVLHRAITEWAGDGKIPVSWLESAEEHKAIPSTRLYVHAAKMRREKSAECEAELAKMRQENLAKTQLRCSPSEGIYSHN